MLENVLYDGSESMFSKAKKSCQSAFLRQFTVANKALYQRQMDTRACKLQAPFTVIPRWNFHIVYMVVAAGSTAGWKSSNWASEKQVEGILETQVGHRFTGKNCTVTRIESGKPLSCVCIFTYRSHIKAEQMINKGTGALFHEYYSFINNSSKSIHNLD